MKGDVVLSVTVVPPPFGEIARIDVSTTEGDKYLMLDATNSRVEISPAFPTDAQHIQAPSQWPIRFSGPGTLRVLYYTARISRLVPSKKRPLSFAICKAGKLAWRECCVEDRVVAGVPAWLILGCARGSTSSDLAGRDICPPLDLSTFTFQLNRSGKTRFLATKTRLTPNGNGIFQCASLLN
jgi:hypothetical protein